MNCKKNCSNRYSNVDFDFGSPNRFDLEMAIANQLDVLDDLSSIIEDILEGEGVTLDPDQLVNTLQGVINLHTMRYHKLWDTFKNLFQLDGQLDGMYNEEDNNEEDYYG